jgi:ribosome-binding protein aMBF1 (putative translation factor)
VSDDAKPTRPSSTTREAEAADAQVHAAPDEMPSPEDEEAAERAPEESPEVAENYREAIERGARQEGEGRLP